MSIKKFLPVGDETESSRSGVTSRKVTAVVLRHLDLKKNPQKEFLIGHATAVSAHNDFPSSHLELCVSEVVGTRTTCACPVIQHNVVHRHD